MDFLAKRKEFVFLNERNALVRVHTMKVKNTDFDIWTEGKGKRYREAIRLVEAGLAQIEARNMPPVIIVASSKLGKNSYSSYDHQTDVIYYSNRFSLKEKLEERLKHSDFEARNITDVLRHELGHKRHWDAIKRYYIAHYSRYNNIKQAKNDLDSKLKKYIASQNLSFLVDILSYYAYISFENGSVNEVIAEYYVHGKTSDPQLDKLIKEELNYGQASSNGYT